MSEPEIRAMRVQIEDELRRWMESEDGPLVQSPTDLVARLNSRSPEQRRWYAKLAADRAGLLPEEIEDVVFELDDEDETLIVVKIVRR